MDDEQLRRAYAALQARRPSTPREMVPLERIRALAEGELRGEERAVALDAVLADPDARRELDLLRGIAGERPRSFRGAFWPAVATLALAASVIFVWRNASTRQEEPMRGGEALSVVGPEDRAIWHGRDRFTWRSLRDGQTYTLEIVTEQGDSVYATTTTDTSLSLPDSMRVASKVSWRWWVTATRLDGSQLRSVTRVLLPGTQ